MVDLASRPVRPSALAAVAGSFGRDVGPGLTAIASVVEKARDRGAALVVLPECALGGYPCDGEDLGPERALSLDGPEIRQLVEIAGPTVLCAGFTEAADDTAYSSAVCVTGDGILGHHRKVHLPPSEVGTFAAGSGFRTFDTPVGRMGMLLCYDKVFPEAARALALDGAEIVASLAAWPTCRFQPARRVPNDRQTRQFNLLDQARAVENQVIWVSANQAGRVGRLRFMGQAKIVDAEGQVLARTGGRAGVALAHVDVTAALRRARGPYWHLGDRSPGSYGLAGIALRSLQSPATVRAGALPGT
jgi:predicted amidohydrolase